MRLYKYLTEKWIKSFKSRGDIIEIFKNPTKKEFKEVAGTTDFDFLKGEWVRFIADIENREVYIWHPEIIHSMAWSRIGDNRPFTDVTLLTGVAQIKGGKWKMADSDEGVNRNLMAYGIEDWEWANKWIDLTDYLKKMKKRLNL
jgi:hypothetical protein